MTDMSQTIPTLSDDQCDEMLTGGAIFPANSKRPCLLPEKMFDTELVGARSLLRFAFALGTVAGKGDYLSMDMIAPLIRGNGLLEPGTVRPFRHTEDMDGEQLDNVQALFTAAFELGKQSSTYN
ncbi:hypothetical protein LG293_16570 (plasmid) [Citricoccus nitrophenolicus]